MELTQIETPLVENKKSRRGWPKGKPRKIQINKNELGQSVLNIANQLMSLSDSLQDLGNRVTELDAKLLLIKRNL